MGLLRFSLIHFAVVALLLAPLAGAMSGCHEGPTAPTVKTERGLHPAHHMSAHRAADAGSNSHQNRPCCEQCSAVCAMSGFATLAVAGLLPEADFPRARSDGWYSASRHINPSPPSLFRPPISIA